MPDSVLMEATVTGGSDIGDFLQKVKDPALKETGWGKEVATK